MRILLFMIIFYFTQIIISQTNNYSMKKFGRNFMNIEINGKQAQYLDGFLLVKLKDGFTKGDLEEELSDYSFSIYKDHFNSKGWGLLEFSQIHNILNVKNELSNIHSVKLIDLNYKIDLLSTYPNDPYFYYQWSFRWR